MTTASTAKVLAQEQAFNAAMSATGMAETNSLQRCERVLNMLLTQRGDAFAEIERVLADHPEFRIRALFACRTHRARR